jgi:hypothetical protein
MADEGFASCRVTMRPLDVLRVSPILVQGVVVERENNASILRVDRVLRGSIRDAQIRLADVEPCVPDVAGIRPLINQSLVIGLSEQLVWISVEDSALEVVAGSKIIEIASSFVALSDNVPSNDAPALASLAAIHQHFKSLVEPDQLILMDAIQLGHLPVSQDEQRETIATALASRSDAVHARGISLAYNLKLLDEFLDSCVDGLMHRDAWVRQTAIACLRDVRGTDDGYESLKIPQEQLAVIDRWRVWADERKRSNEVNSSGPPANQVPAKE